MRHTFRLAEPGSPEITVDNSQFTGIRVSVEGQRLSRLLVRGRPAWEIRMADGTSHRVSFAGSMTGLRAIVDGERVIQLERRFAIWELILAVLPIGLLGLTGVAGGVLGVLAIVVNLRILRLPRPLAVRIAGTLASLAMAGIVSYPIALAINV